MKDAVLTWYFFFQCVNFACRVDTMIYNVHVCSQPDRFKSVWGLNICSISHIRYQQTTIRTMQVVMCDRHSDRSKYIYDILWKKKKSNVPKFKNIIYSVWIYIMHLW